MLLPLFLKLLRNPLLLKLFLKSLLFLVLHGRVAGRKLDLKVEGFEMLRRTLLGIFLLPLGVGSDFLLGLLLPLLVLILIVDISPQVLYVGVLFLLFVTGKGLPTITTFLLLEFLLFFLLLLPTFSSFDDHLFASFFVLLELLRNLRSGFVPFTHYLNYYSTVMPQPPTEHVRP